MTGKEINCYEEFTIIDILPPQTYYSKALICNRLCQMIGVMDSEGNKMNVKLYPPFSANSFEPGDKIRLWLAKLCTDKKLNNTKYYKDKTCEPMQTAHLFLMPLGHKYKPLPMAQSVGLIWLNNTINGRRLICDKTTMWYENNNK